MTWDLCIVLPVNRDAHGAFGDDSPCERLGSHDEVTAKLAPLTPAMKKLKIEIDIPQGDDVRSVSMALRPKGDPDIEPRHPIWALVHDIQKETGWRVVDTSSGELIETDGPAKSRPQNEPWRVLAVRVGREVRSRSELPRQLAKWSALGTREEVMAAIRDVFPGIQAKLEGITFYKWKAEHYAVEFMEEPDPIRSITFTVNGYNGGRRKKEHPSRALFRQLAARTGWRLADEWSEEFIEGT